MATNKTLYNDSDIKVATGESDETFIVITEGRSGMVITTQEQAIAAARAILKHFGECE